MKSLNDFLVNIWASPHQAIGIRPETGKLVTGLMGSLCCVARWALGPRLSGRGLPPYGRHHFAALMRVPSRYAGFRITYFFGFFILSILSCQVDSDQSTWKEYYYPTNELEDGLVYIYEVTSQDSVYEDVWFYKSILEDTISYFTTQQYDPEFNVTRFQLFHLTDWGAELDTDIHYTTDSMGLAVPHESEVIENQSFKNKNDNYNGSYQSSVRYKDMKSMEAIHKITTRQYLKDTSFVYNNKEIPAILIDVKEMFKYDKSGRSDVTQGTEIYAQGYGLVYKVKNNPGERKLTHQLDTIYKMEDFLKIRFSE